MNEGDWVRIYSYNQDSPTNHKMKLSVVSHDHAKIQGRGSNPSKCEGAMDAMSAARWGIEGATRSMSRERRRMREAATDWTLTAALDA